MKYLIFLLSPVFMQAQIPIQGDAVKDSTVYVKPAQNVDNYLKFKITKFENGDSIVSGQQVGTASTLARTVQSDFLNRVENLAIAARVVITGKKTFNAIIQEDAQIKALTGTSPLDTIQARFAPAFVAGTWVLRNLTTDTQQPVVFTVNVQGVFRYKVGADAVKACITIGSGLLLRNYPTTGNDLILYRLPNGAWFDPMRQYRLKAN